MTWPNGIALFSACVTAVLGFVAVTRSWRSDKALDTAANVKTTFDAQATLIQDLQTETARLRVDLRGCEERHHETALKLGEAHSKLDQLTRRIAALEAQLHPGG